MWENSFLNLCKSSHFFLGFCANFPNRFLSITIPSPPHLQRNLCAGARKRAVCAGVRKGGLCTDVMEMVNDAKWSHGCCNIITSSIWGIEIVSMWFMSCGVAQTAPWMRHGPQIITTDLYLTLARPPLSRKLYPHPPSQTQACSCSFA